MLFSTRRGGVSEGPYASLNLGRLTADDGANVDANRERLAAAVGLPRERFLYGRQVHGARVRRATEPPGADAPAAEEDGQATALPDGPPRSSSSPTACPCCSPSGGVAALHGGWRGLAAGSSPRASRRCASSAATASRSRPRSARGARLLLRDRRGGARGVRRVPGARVGERNVDLAAVARHQLAAAGVEQVHDAGLCTICAEPGLFFSHRRDAGVTGRQAGVVWRA